jgi:pimeloyl-ACP methyl ester carboxylesterase
LTFEPLEQAALASAAKNNHRIGGNVANFVARGNLDAVCACVMHLPVSDATEQAFDQAYQAMLGLWTAPPTSRDVAIGGETTRVQVWGRADAPPLLLMHGFHVTSTMWAPNAADLGAVRRVYAPDTVGDYGYSRTTHVPRGLDELLVWVEALIDALGLQTIDIGGMSYGGWLAAAFAARRPERVRRVVLLAPGASFGRFSLAFALRGLPMLMFRRRSDVDAYLRWAAVPAPGDARYEAWMRALVDVMHAGICNFRGRTLPLPQRLKPETMRAIAAPTLLVYGEQEKMYPARRAIEVARTHVPKLETLLVPDASHDLTLRQSRLIDDAVVRFLG